MESVAAVENINALLTSCPRIAAVVFNAANFLKDLAWPTRATPCRFSTPAARWPWPAGRPAFRPLTGPGYDAKDRAGFEADARNARALGFTGKLAVNGGQVPLVNEIFA